jgi:hypothetical protein
MLLLEIRAASCALCCAVRVVITTKQDWRLEMCEPG